MLSSQFTPVQFWEQALRPIQELAKQDVPDPRLVQQYTLCAENAFGNFTFERLFALFKEMNWRFILLLDEFDFLRHHPVLNKAEF